jgi:hypothetical protein
MVFWLKVKASGLGMGFRVGEMAHSNKDQDIVTVISGLTG